MFLSHNSTVLSPWTADQWRHYFRANSAAPSTPWDQGLHLPRHIRKALLTSLRAFHRQQKHQGRNLLRQSPGDDEGYSEVLRDCLIEDARHAQDIERLLEMAGVKPLDKAWPAPIWRLLRRFAGEETSLMILLTQQVIARAYYSVLHDASVNRLLCRLCHRMMYDEMQHIRFFCERLAMLRADRSGLRLACSKALHWMQFTLSCVSAWRKHRAALRAGGYGWLGFWRFARQELDRAWFLMDPRRYALPDAPRLQLRPAI